jgi:hypothetical protein
LVWIVRPDRYLVVAQRDSNYHAEKLALAPSYAGDRGGQPSALLMDRSPQPIPPGYVSKRLPARGFYSQCKFVVGVVGLMTNPNPFTR